MAMRIRSPNYYLRQFHADCTQAFPELSLYAAASTSTSGRSSDEEYKRTIGALFSLYWLYRLDLQSVPGSAGFDGQRGFCFGVDDTWSPPSVHVVSELLSMHAKGASEPGHASARLVQLTPWQKRLFFYEATDWNALHQLMVDAQLLTVDASGRAEVNVDRTAAMLSLTAFHDIMKVEVLLPTTEGEYHGYSEGQRLLDHDLALGYVLDTDADALPAFASLAPAEQSLVRFTQAELGFNHGWLVQAEAPPGALFSRLKALLDRDRVPADHIAFYFVHWTTDLAGAVGTPLKGAEKFLTRFPHAVFAKMLRSFSVVQRLAHTAPTRLLQEYYQTAWFEGSRPLDYIPNERFAVALMRLVMQMQQAISAQELVDAFMAISAEDRDVLAAEMALSGIAGEYFSLSPQRGGPAFLVYYGPAFVRRSVPDETREMLTMLAEVYRCARMLWPLRSDADSEGCSVTVRIDALKDSRATEVNALYNAGKAWVLVRKGDLDAVVEQWPIDEFTSRAGSLGPDRLCAMRLWEHRTRVAPPTSAALEHTRKIVRGVDRILKSTWGTERARKSSSTPASSRARDSGVEARGPDIDPTPIEPMHIIAAVNGQNVYRAREFFSV